MADYFCTHCGCRHEPLAHIDGRDSRPNPRQPIFRDHNCWKCRDGELPCTGRSDGDYGRCEYPHARND